MSFYRLRIRVQNLDNQDIRERDYRFDPATLTGAKMQRVLTDIQAIVTELDAEVAGDPTPTL